MISNAYSYYMTQYGNRIHSKYDTHTKIQLRRASGKVLKVNSQTPSYKIDFSVAAQKYAIDLKEHARELSYIAQDLSDDDNGQMTFRKSAQSTDPAVASAEYIGDGSTSDLPSMDIVISRLAESQVNTGNFLPSGGISLAAGSYAFDLNINNLTYEFQFNVSDGDSNEDIQKKISRLINRSNIGLTASVISDGSGSSAISIASNATGVTGIRPTIFNIESSDAKMISTLGLSNVSQYPSNAVFTVNGEQNTSASNHIAVGKTFLVNLNSVSAGGEPTTISLSTDGDAMMDSIHELFDGYNSLVSIASNRENDRFSGNDRLRREFTNMTRAYQYTLNSSGLGVEKDGSVRVDNNNILEAIGTSSLSEIFSGLNDFKNAIQRKAEDIAINPMSYVNNKIISYKNPNRQFSDPYNLSAYTGMMFNGYC